MLKALTRAINKAATDPLIGITWILGGINIVIWTKYYQTNEVSKEVLTFLSALFGALLLTIRVISVRKHIISENPAPTEEKEEVSSERSQP